MNTSPQIAIIALLVRKFGKKIEGGGYEIEVSHQEMQDLLLPDGTFQEIPNLEMHKVKWQYFPNPTIEGTITVEGTLTEEGVKVFSDLLEPETTPLETQKTDEENL